MQTSAILVFAWLALTAVVNTVAHVVTPDDADKWAERNPRIAQLATIMRRFGVEPVAGIAAIYAFFAGNPPLPGLPRAIGMVGRRGVANFQLLLLVSVLGLLVVACGLLGSAAAVPVATIIDGAVCDLAAQQTNEPAIETFICDVIDPASGKKTQLTVRVPKEQAQAFAIAHSGSK